MNRFSAWFQKQPWFLNFIHSNDKSQATIQQSTKTRLHSFEPTLSFCLEVDSVNENGVCCYCCCSKSFWSNNCDENEPLTELSDEKQNTKQRHRINCINKCLNCVSADFTIGLSFESSTSPHTLHTYLSMNIWNYWTVAEQIYLDLFGHDLVVRNFSITQNTFEYILYH